MNPFNHLRRKKASKLLFAFCIAVLVSTCFLAVTALGGINRLTYRSPGVSAPVSSDYHPVLLHQSRAVYDQYSLSSIQKSISSDDIDISFQSGEQSQFSSTFLSYIDYSHKGSPIQLRLASLLSDIPPPASTIF